MLTIGDGQCGRCAHFGEDHDDRTELVRIRVRGEAPPDYVDACGHPSNASVHLRVSATSACDGFQPLAA